MYDTSRRGPAASRSPARPARGVVVSPRAYPLVGHLPLLRDVLTAAAQLRSLGDVVKLRVPPHDVFVLHHPRDIEQWLVHEHAAFRKDWSTKALEQVLGQGPLLSDGPPLRRGRWLAQAELAPRRVEALVPRMQACIDGLLAHLLDAAAEAAAHAAPRPSRPSQPAPAAAPEAAPSPELAVAPTPGALVVAAPEDAPGLPRAPAHADAGSLSSGASVAPSALAAAEAPAPAAPGTKDETDEPVDAAGARAAELGPSEPAEGGAAAPEDAGSAASAGEDELGRPTTLYRSVLPEPLTHDPAPAPEARAAAVPDAALPDAALPDAALPNAGPREAALASDVAAPSILGGLPELAPGNVSPAADPARTASGTLEPLRDATPPPPSGVSLPARESDADLASAVRPKLGTAADAGAGETTLEPSAPAGAPWDLLELMMRLSLDLAVSTLLGRDTDRVAPALQPLLEQFLRQQLASHAGLRLPDWLPTRGNRRARANHERLARVLREAVAARRAGGEAVALQPDLLGRLLRTRDEAGAPLSDAQITDEALAHLLHGHEPVALLLTFAITQIAQHPEVERRVLAELDEHASYPGENPLAAVERLPYLDAVLRETLRLFPVSFAIAREAVADTRIGECNVPRGAQVWAFQWSVHRDPRFFHMAERFRPERWVHGETRDLPRFAYFPLTGGLHSSPGAHFVMAQVKLALARLVPRLSFRLVLPGAPAVVAGSTLRPKDGLPVYVALR